MWLDLVEEYLIVYSELDVEQDVVQNVKYMQSSPLRRRVGSLLGTFGLLLLSLLLRAERVGIRYQVLGQGSGSHARLGQMLKQPLLALL